MSPDFPAHTTSVVLTAPGDFDGLRRLIVFGEPQGFAEKMGANDGGPFKVERVGRRGKRTELWLNPQTIAYFVAGPPLGEMGSPEDEDLDQEET